LAVTIQGTYDSHRDRAVLKELKIRRAVAEARGEGDVPEKDAGPVSYNDPKSRQALERLADERISPDSLAQIKQRFGVADPAATTTERTPADRPPAESAAADTSALYEAIYEELINAVVIAHREVRLLAIERAKSVRRELTGTDGIAARRVSLAEPTRAKRSSAKAQGIITKLDVFVAK
jgi:hypothetical protein